jgi:two-component system, LytTR family, sensor kinase
MTIARPPDLVLVSEALGNGAALVLTAVLFLLIIRTARSNFAMWLAAFCALLWSGASLAATLLILGGAAPDSAQVWIAKRAEMVSGGIFPLSFLLLWPVPLPADSWRARLRRWLLRIAIGVAALTLIALVNVQTPPRGTLHFAMSLVPFVAAILMTFGALSILQGRLKTPADRVYVFLTLMGMWVSGVSILVLERFTFSAGVCAALTAVKEQAPFLTLIGTIFFFARFRAADVLIKSSLQIVVGTVLALGTALIVAEPGPGLIGSALSSELAERILLKTTALLGLLIFLYLAASRGIKFVVDRWVLPRPDYRAALRELWNELNALDSETDIFAAAQKRVQFVLDPRRVCFEPAATSGFPHDPDRDSDCNIQAPVRVRGERTHVLVVQERYCRALLSADIRFLEDAAALVGWRIEALLAERERIERQAREAKLLQLAAESELKALRAQINPHFLFNSLNTIADLIVTDPAKAETMTVLLAKVFRHVLLYSDRQLTAVSEEIEFLRTYLRIEEVRFGDRLGVRMDVDPDVFSARVPSLILQPVVENAIKHGLAPKIGPGHLQIRAGRDGSFIKLEVEDDGVGFSESGPRRGVGLKIIAERLKTLYKTGATLQFESASALGSRVTILIPVEAEAQ